jgi:hypothetical protein
MCQAKDAADKPCGKRPARTCEKSHASPNDNQFNIDFCRHLNVPLVAMLHSKRLQSMTRLLS